MYSKKLKIKTKNLLRELRGLRVEVIRLKRLFKKKLKKHLIKVILAYSYGKYNLEGIKFNISLG